VRKQGQWFRHKVTEMLVLRASQTLGFLAAMVIVYWVTDGLFFETFGGRADISFYFKMLAISASRIWLAIIELSFSAVVFAGGTVLYAFRCRTPGLYGALEVAAGVFIATFVVNVLLGNVGNVAAGFFTIVGALYIIVRGYDNVYKSMQAGTDQIRRWNRWFFGKDSEAKL
jgi:hypothetical protein